MKLKYFKIEPEIVKLKELSDPDARNKNLLELLGFLGADPIEKVNNAFLAEYNQGIREYLELK